MTDFEDSTFSRDDVENNFVHVNTPNDTSECEPFDHRLYRSFAVTVSVTIHDIQAHLVKVMLPSPEKN